MGCLSDFFTFPMVNTSFGESIGTIFFLWFIKQFEVIVQPYEKHVIGNSYWDITNKHGEFLWGYNGDTLL